MSHRSRRVDRQRRQKRGRGVRGLWWAVGALALVIIVGVPLLLSNTSPDNGGAVVAPSSPERVGPLEVSATQIDLGRVSLGRWVNPTFRLRNVSAEPVTLTIPRSGVEALEGC